MKTKQLQPICFDDYGNTLQPVAAIVCYGIHKNCGGGADRYKTSMIWDVLSCQRCNWRVYIPASIKTWIELQEWVGVKCLYQPENKTVEELEKRLKVKETVIDTYRKSLNEKNTQISELRKEEAKLKEQITKQREYKDKLVVEYNEMQRELNKVYEKNEQLELDFKRIYETNKQLQAYCNKLATSLSEGMLPKDIENLRKANTELGQEVWQLKAKLSNCGFYASKLAPFVNSIVIESKTSAL